MKPWCYFPGDGFDLAQIDGTVGLGWGTDGDEDDLRIGHPPAQTGGKGEPTGFHVPLKEGLQIFFIKGDLLAA